MARAREQAGSSDRVPAKLAGRITACNTAVTEAVWEEEENGTLSRKIARSLAAAGAEADLAGEYAAAIQAYVQEAPFILHDLLKAARTAAVPQERERLVRQATAVVEEVERAQDVPGLEGLLGAAYLAHSLSTESNSGEDRNGETHQVVGDLLGPERVQSLDERLAELGLAEEDSRKPSVGRGVARAGGAAANRAQTGPCDDCAHQRRGSPLARSAYDSVIKALQPSLRQAYTQKMDAERERSGSFLSEQQSAARYTGRDQAYSSRPTDQRVSYCGAHEFEGSYLICEVKNSDPPCLEFTPRAVNATPKPCGSCRHLYRAPDSLLRSLEEITGRPADGQQSAGSAVREEMRQTLQSQAQWEYEACVDEVGLLQEEPGCLSICEARSAPQSAAGMWVVGPILNAAGQCDQWAPGQNARVSRVDTEMQELMAAAKRGAADYENLPVNDGDNPGLYSDQFKAEAANAEADVLQFGLLALKVESTFVDSLCGRFMRDSWRVAARTDRVSRANSEFGRAAFRHKNAPFEVEQHKEYRHPDVVGLVVRWHQYFLQNAPVGSWATMPGDDGTQLPVCVQASEDRRRMYAMWLEPGNSQGAAPVRGATAAPALSEEEQIELLNYSMRTQQAFIEAVKWVLKPKGAVAQRLGLVASMVYSEPEVTQLSWSKTVMRVDAQTRAQSAQNREVWRKAMLQGLKLETKFNPKMQPLREFVDGAS